MINEIDIKDFLEIDCTKARSALTDMYVQSAYWTNNMQKLEEFINQIEYLQMQFKKPIAALFIKKEQE